MRISWLLVSLLAVARARANVKGVFAHFMVGGMPYAAVLFGV